MVIAPLAAACIQAVMRNRRNYYRILHVQPDAPLPIIRSSYRALMLQLEMHPDRGGEHWNAALINEAHATLSSEERRREYDRSRARQSKPAAAAGRAPAASDPAPAAPAGDPASVSEQAPAGASESVGETEGAERCVFCQAACNPRASEDPRGCCSVCSSPLFPAGRVDLVASGRRAASRFERQRDVRISTDWPQAAPLSGVMRDVSPRGIRIETANRLRPYQIVRIDGGPLQATGRVSHSTRGTCGDWISGIEFFTLLVEAGSLISRQV